MAAASMRKNKKRVSLRKIAAKHFLSNISLDGTYADTKYMFSDWKHHRIKEEDKAENKSELEKDTNLANPTVTVGKENAPEEQSNSSPQSSETLLTGYEESPRRPRAQSMYTGKQEPLDADSEKYKFDQKVLPKRWR